MNRSARPNRLYLPRTVLAAYWRLLFNFISPDCTVFGLPSTLIVEPIAIFRIEHHRVQTLEPIEPPVDPSFDPARVRSQLARQAEYEDEDRQDQAFVRLAEGIYEVDDNPWMFPMWRLGKVVDMLGKGELDASAIDGVFHCHPTEDATPSATDDETLGRLADVVGRDLLSVTVAVGPPERLVALARQSSTEFAATFEANEQTLTFQCWTYGYGNKSRGQVILTE